jgi:heme-degrading monooxygenase HmoA
MFRALYVHHQKVEFTDAASGIVIVSQWPSGVQVEKFFSQPVHRTATY